MEKPTLDALLYQAERDFLEHGAQTNALIKEALAQNPGHGFAQLLRGFILLQAGVDALIPAAKKCVAHTEAAPKHPNPQTQARLERLLPALRAWCSGGMEDANHALEAALRQDPSDLFVLKMLTLNQFWLGHIEAMCNNTTWVLENYTHADAQAKADDHPFPQAFAQRSFVHGMLAFGLEESGDFAKAEIHAKQAIKANPQDLWAVHALAHVFEAQGRHKEAIDELSQYTSHWEKDGPFSGHLWWHLALHYFEQGAFEQVLALYDERVRLSASDFFLDLQNAVSLLWRLELCGVGVSQRWDELAESCARHSQNLSVPFTFFHMIPAFMRSGREGDAQKAIDWLQDQAQNSQRSNRIVLQNAVLPSCQGLLAYAKQNWSHAQTLLGQACEQMHLAGGSRAQRDVLEQTHICAAMHAANWSQAKDMLAERVTRLPHSAPSWQWQVTTLQALGQTEQAQQAQQQVQKLTFSA